MKKKLWDNYTDLMYGELSGLSGKIREAVTDLKLQIERQQAERRVVRLMLGLISLLMVMMMVLVVWVRG